MLKYVMIGLYGVNTMFYVKSELNEYNDMRDFDGINGKEEFSWVYLLIKIISYKEKKDFKISNL